MNTTQEQLLRLLTLAIHGGIPIRESFSSINGKELFNLATKQNVCSILYPVLKIHSEDIKLDEQIIRKWKTATLFIATRQLSMINGMKTIFDLFISNDIPAISLKGLVLKQLYPQPELRNMCDIDLLIDEKDMQKSIELLSTLGYHPNSMNLKDPKHMHIEMEKPSSFSVELHRTLWHTHFMRKKDNDIWFNHIWENKRRLEVEGIQFTALALEDELINLVIHLATHLIYSGANLRQLCDIVLFLNTYWEMLDLEYVNQTIKSMDLFIFFQYLLATCHLFLGLTIPTNSDILEKNISEILMNDIFNSEIYSQTTDQSEGWRTLSCRYAFARNNQFLIPLALGIEVGLQFVKKRKNFLYSISYAKESFKGFRTRARFLHNIGLL